MENVYDLLKRLEFSVEAPNQSPKGDKSRRACPECGGVKPISKSSLSRLTDGPDRGHLWGCKLKAHLDFDKLQRGCGTIQVKGMDRIRGEVKGLLRDFRYEGAQLLIELENGEQLWCCSIFRPQF